MKNKSKKTDYKDIKNAWIDPDGNIIPVGYMGHNQWAYEYLLTQFKPDDIGIVDVYGEIHKHNLSYPWEYLCKVKNWVRLLNWTGLITATKVVGYSENQRPNASQRDALFLWCSANGFKYEDLFKY